MSCETHHRHADGEREKDADFEHLPVALALCEPKLLFKSYKIVSRHNSYSLLVECLTPSVLYFFVEFFYLNYILKYTVCQGVDNTQNREGKWDIISSSGMKWDPTKNKMLIGEYLHTLDAKKRLSLPAKFRKEVGKKVVVTRGLDSCLFMFPQNTWKEIATKLANLPMGQADTRGIARFILAGAVETDVDTAGRILIPDFLKEFADLRSRVVLAGVSDRIEIWNDKTWEEYKRRIEKGADQMAQTLGDLGVL